MKINNTMTLAQIGPLMEDIKDHARAKSKKLLGENAHAMGWNGFISFDADGITYNYERNTSCKCHPEWEWDSFTWSYEDFDFDIPD